MRTFSLQAFATQLAQPSGSLEMTVALVEGETDGSSCSQSRCKVCFSTQRSELCGRKSLVHFIKKHEAKLVSFPKIVADLKTINIYLVIIMS